MVRITIDPTSSTSEMLSAAEKLNIILGWLNAWNCKEMHKRTSLLRQPGTCTWLPNTNEFQTWRNTKDSFLWLHGKGGMFDTTQIFHR